MDKEYAIDQIIEQTKQRRMELLQQYEAELQNYPRGSLVIRVVNGRKYCYFRYRDGKRVITKYAGTEAKHEELVRLIEQRDRTAEEVKRIKGEIDRISKIEMLK